MEHLTIHFDVDPGVQADETAARVQQGLSRVADVEQATAKPERTRFLTGLEIIAAISLVSNIVNVIHQGSQVIHDTSQIAADTKPLIGPLRAFFSRIADVVKGTPGVRQARVDVGLKSVPVTELSDADIQRIADALVQRMSKPQTT